MEKLLKFYNQNRHMVWLIILIIIAIIGLIQILNGFASKKTEERKNIIDENRMIFEDTSDSNYSVITDKEVKKEVSEIIDEFINYCNEKQVQKAYELLSKDCKEVLYPTLEDFTNKYYSKLFDKKKTYGYQAWTTKSNTHYTYKVDFVEDMLATGNTSSTSIVDYYTVVRNNDRYELNINKFVGSEVINKSETRNNVTININKKRIYIDYETYEINVSNKTDKKLKLDTLESSNTIYLENEKSQKYYWYSHEVLEEDIEVNRLQSKKIDMKFNKYYQANNNATKVIFGNIDLDGQIFKIEIDL